MACALAAGCSPAARVPASPQPPPASAPTSAAAAASESDATGVWDWLFRSTTQQGDLRVEQEEWHLEQQGPRILGYYNRQVITMSTDQRPYRCNGMLGFVKNTRVRIVGEVRSGQVELREVGADTERNPCDDGARNLMHYVGRLQGDSLVLQFTAGGEQRLIRRTSNTAALNAGPAAPSLPPAEEGAAALAVSLSGVWEWQFRAVDAEGDLHVEREEWHLTEANSEITGYYERTLERARTSGVFPCNNTPLISNKTRYTVKGQRFADKFVLAEVDYTLVPSPCDNGMRRLDSYQGTLLPQGRLLLTWGAGQQILKKR